MASTNVVDTDVDPRFVTAQPHGTDAERAERRGHLRNIAQCLRQLADVVDSDEFNASVSDYTVAVFSCIVSELTLFRLESFGAVVKAWMARCAKDAYPTAPKNVEGGE